MSNTKLSVSEIIKRMQVATGASNNTKLAELFGYSSTGTISQWKKSDNVPDKAIRIISEKMNVSFEWIKSGRGEMRNATPMPKDSSGIESVCENCIQEQESPYIRKVAQMMKDMDTETQKDICLGVEKEKLLHDLLRQQTKEKEKAS